MINTDIYEKNVLVKLFHNKDLQTKYLPDILPALFYDRRRRVLVHIMKLLYENKLGITVENIIISQNTRRVKAILRKEKESVMNQEEVWKELNDFDVDTGSSMFEEAFLELHDLAFARFVDEIVPDINYDLAYNKRDSVLARTKAINQVYDIIFKSKLKSREDQIGNAINVVNSGGTYKRLSSSTLNSFTGGVSKGFITTIVGKPSHGKSTLMTFESAWQVKNEKEDRIDVIGPEETPDVFWRRILAIELGIPITRLTQGEVQISREEERRIKDIYGGKIHFHDISSLKDITDLTWSLSKKSKFIWLDHVNAVSYYNDDQTRGITGLINMQKAFLKENPEAVIFDLSQVNTKKMQFNKRLRPTKADAFASSVLEQASREFLVVYYPYKDAISEETKQYFLGKGNKLPQPDIVQIIVEKNSFGDVGEFRMKYLPEYSRFQDMPDRLQGLDLLLPNESGDLFNETVDK